MPTYWQKTAWWPGDLDRITGGISPTAFPPGIYCEDREAFAALRRHAWEQEPEMTYGLGGEASIGGMRVYVATPAQAKILRAMPARSPDEALAEQKAATDAMIAKIDQLMALVAPKPAPRPAPRPAPPPPATRHPFRGANRKAKRAAAARARRRA